MIEFAPHSPYMTYQEAVLYCKFLEHDGYTDWSMPTYNEYRCHTALGWYVEFGERTNITGNTVVKLRVNPVRTV
jgi:hypothetical protein